ncbi:MAG TPA: hypothetical protein VMF64_13200 [Steroidobacteraceae bacterium]|nr:hypothetical protein [Steroidobacteraceae bacterium]
MSRRAQSGPAARGLGLSALLALLLVGCASAPPEDATTDQSAPQSAVPSAASASAPAVSSVPAPPQAADSVSGANANDATLTPAQRQARARQAATQADQAAQQALQQQCSDLRSQIREQQLDEQQAPSTSVSEEIVQAKEAHADQRIQNLQDRYDSLDCPSVIGPRAHTPLLPVSPAPNGLSPPGAQGVP